MKFANADIDELVLLYLKAIRLTDADRVELARQVLVSQIEAQAAKPRELQMKG